MDMDGVYRNPQVIVYISYEIPSKERTKYKGHLEISCPTDKRSHV